MSDKEIVDSLKIAISQEELINKVGLYVSRDGMGYAEAIIHICNDLSIDPEDIASLISGPLKTKVQVEAVRNNMLPSKNNSVSLV